MSEQLISLPLRISFSLTELETELKRWMVEQFGHPRDQFIEPDQRDKWYRDYGLIYHFLRDQFEGEVVGLYPDNGTTSQA